MGVGSIAASLAGALAVHEIVSGVDPALSALVLAEVFLRSVSMAWFPWPRTQPTGLRVYPLIAVTGPLASALGMLAVWVVVLGGQMLSAGGHYWLALSSVPLAILIVLLATFAGRLGRTLIPHSAPNRVDIHDLLTPEPIDRGRELALSRNPLPGSGTKPPSWPAEHSAGNGSPWIHGDRLIPPIGPFDGPWAAFRPSRRLNWRRIWAFPVGVVSGAATGLAMAAVFRGGQPLPEAVGLLVTVWVWLGGAIGPLFCTLLHVDDHRVGEKGLWTWRGLAPLDLDCLVRQRGGVVFSTGT